MATTANRNDANLIVSNSASNPLAQASYGYHRKLSASLRAAVVRQLPRSVKQQFRFLQRLSKDARDVILGRHRGELVPPHCLNFVGDGDFEEVGNEFFQYLTQLGQLESGDRVLEVGCGIGRMAVPLTKYLVSGSYEGIDIVPRGIRWASKHISTRYPNFRFQLADLYNLTYNPHGRLHAHQYQFPFPSCEFDFVFLISVFTHMLPRDLENYLREIHRVLRPNGTCLATFFLLNNESKSLMSKGQSSLDLKFELGDCRVENDRMPENVIAYDESRVRSLYDSVALTIQNVRYGAWPGRADYLGYQDIMVARKVAPENQREIPSS